MPVELIAFTADRRIRGAIPLADDRLSDMLNSVPRIVIRGAEVKDIVFGGPVTIADVTLAVGSIVAVLSSGRRGLETLRRRTDLHRARIGLDRYIVTGSLHLPDGEAAPPSREPQVVLAGRDVLVPITEATIAYDCRGEIITEQFETILINRTQAAWVDLDGAADGDEEIVDERPKTYHAAMAKDFTGAT